MIPDFVVLDCLRFFARCLVLSRLKPFNVRCTGNSISGSGDSVYEPLETKYIGKENENIMDKVAKELR